MKNLSCAPAKAILFGEHYTVYGAPGIVAAIEPKNKMQIETAPSDDAHLNYITTRKESCISQKLSEGKYSPHPISALYCHYSDTYPQISKMKINAKVLSAWNLKGVGNSASLSACFAYGIRKALKLKTDLKDIFWDVHIAETAAHGSPSGIDAAAVCFGGVLEYKKNFEGSADISKIKFKIGKEFSFALIDTYSKDREHSNTKEMIEKFAKANSIRSKPQEISKKQRNGISSPYVKIFERAQEALNSADMNLLSDCMNKNHSLLKKSNVSSKSIELALSTALKNGALGAKMTAAGGIGGAAIALCEKSKIERMTKALSKNGFEVYEFNISKKGVGEL